MLEKILAVETRAKAVGLGITAMCQHSGINRTTWQRWKSGDRHPGLESWENVLETVMAAESAHRKENPPPREINPKAA